MSPSLLLPSHGLFDLVVAGNWDRVIQHAHLYPQDAAWTNTNESSSTFSSSSSSSSIGETPLYLACLYDAPAPCIRALVKAYPKAVTTHCGRRRRHCSRHGRGQEEEELLLPIHVACRIGASCRVLEALLERHPQTALLESNNYNHHQKKKKTKNTYSNALMALCEGFKQQTDNNNNRQQRIQKVEIVLGAMARALNLHSDDGEWLLLHAAASLGETGCPRPVLNHVLKKYAHQTSLFDATRGQLPLHVAIRHNHHQHHESDDVNDVNNNDKDGMVQRLLKRYPLAAKLSHRDRLPLHMAALAGQTWYGGGVRDIFRAHPDALFWSDPRSGLWPFQLAAIPDGKQDTVSLDAIFHLLVENPAVLQVVTKTANHKNSKRHGTPSVPTTTTGVN